MRKKALFLTLLLVTLTGILFWGGSRYPSLNSKATMGGDSGISGIGFETVISIPPDASFIFRVLATTINWIYSNIQGMTFGIIFGALLMILVSLLYRQYVQQGLPKALLGGIMGVPLGVCVNCATPIAQGILASGLDAETALALMFSSPTLNVIVLSMMFSLMPTYIALVKVALTLVFILVLLPLLIRWLHLEKKGTLPEELLQEVDLQRGYFERSPEVNRVDDFHLTMRQPETWLNASKWVLSSFISNLGFICRISLPLMLLAGFLGSLLIAVLPFETLANFLPNHGLISILSGMIVVAGVGLFLPVPMAFDVILTVILLASGMPVYYAATLLFALGIFSVYPFGAIATTLSQGIAISLTAVLIILSLAAGALSYQWEGWNFAQQEKQVLQQFRQSDSTPYRPSEERQDWIPDTELVAGLQQEPLKFEPVSVESGSEVMVSRVPFHSESTPATEWGFNQNLGPDLGLEQQDNFSALKLFAFNPLMYSRGIASGDVHNDGWDDLAVASDSGVNLYANQQGQGYIEQQIHFPEMKNWYVTTVTLVDLNDDSWLDLFFTTYRQGNYVIYNQSGRFLAENIARLPNADDAFVTSATSFGDLDGDGDLDLVLGNWSQIFREVHHDLSASRNVLVTQEDGQFTLQELPGEDGETQTVLFSDINNDNALDLLVGNDFFERDYYYLGDGQGTLTPLTAADGIIPHSTTWTMSLTTADINNDLTPEIYAAQISEAPDEQTLRYPGSIKPEDVCSDYSSSSALSERCLDYIQTRNVSQEARQKKDLFHCLSLDSQQGREACISSFIAFESRNGKNARNLCSYFPDSWQDLAFLCSHTWQDLIRTDLKAEVQGFLKPQVKDKPIPSDRQFHLPPMDNLLLVQQQNGQFFDQTKRFGVELGGWSWNAKFADLNNDEWQDLFIANGAFHFAQSKTSNLLYLNQKGKSFTENATELGLRSWQDTVSYTYNDYDQDGDLDIFAVPAVGPILVYRNRGSTNQSIAFALKDRQGNGFGIGSKIIIRYGKNKARQQVREIQAGGGFASFDSPVVYFGLGEHDRIQQVEIYWSTGELTTITGELAAGYRYLIERPNTSS